MENNQQQIIDSLIAEFNRINSMNANNKTFNLINIEPLNAKTDEIKRYKAMREADKKAWNELAYQEVYRLIDLFKQDLPNACIEKYGKENGHIDIPSIIIGKDERHTRGHSENHVSIHIEVRTNKMVKDSYGGTWSFGSELIYRYGIFNKEYKTIEEVVTSKEFLEELRLKVLS